MWVCAARDTVEISFFAFTCTFMKKFVGISGVQGGTKGGGAGGREGMGREGWEGCTMLRLVVGR